MLHYAFGTENVLDLEKLVLRVELGQVALVVTSALVAVRREHACTRLVMGSASALADSEAESAH